MIKRMLSSSMMSSRYVPWVMPNFFLISAGITIRPFLWTLTLYLFIVILYRGLNFGNLSLALNLSFGCLFR